MKGNKLFTVEEKENFKKSMDRFNTAMEIAERQGQLIAIDFKKKRVIKSKCRKGTLIKKAA